MKEKALYTFKPKGGAYMSNQITLDAVIQNLKDAGCKDDFIKKFILALEIIKMKQYFYCFVNGGIVFLMKYIKNSTNLIVLTI